jgi:hypothetical protein
MFDPTRYLSTERRIIRSQLEREDMQKERAAKEILVYQYLSLIGLLILALVLLIAVLQPQTQPHPLANQLLSFGVGLGGSIVAVSIVFIVHKRYGSDAQVTLENSMANSIADMEAVLQEAVNKIFGANFTENEEMLYLNARHTLESKQEEKWKAVRIFAPIGIWQKDTHKSDWLNTVAAYIATPDTGRSYTQLYAIFGLPPIERNGNLKPMDETFSDLNYVKDTLHE